MTDDGEWTEESLYEAFEVNRQGDSVFFSLSSLDGAVQKFEFAPGDAQTIGLALFHAGQNTEESQ